MRRPLTMRTRPEGPDVWEYRWSEKGHHGKLTCDGRRSITGFGTRRQLSQDELLQHSVRDVRAEIYRKGIQDEPRTAICHWIVSIGDSSRSEISAEA